METISYIERPRANDVVIAGTLQEYRINRPKKRRKIRNLLKRPK